MVHHIAIDKLQEYDDEGEPYSGELIGYIKIQ